jgi:integrase
VRRRWAWVTVRRKARHQLRHSALTHAAEAGANTATLLAYSGHTSVTSPARYARISPKALARWQQRRDPAWRR